MSDQASAITVIGSIQSSPVTSLLGNMISGTLASNAIAAAEPIAATSSASHTTWAWSRSVFDNCCASPRFSPSVASCEANSTISTA